MPEKLLPPGSGPETLVFFLLIFSVVGVFFLFIHLVMGAVIRPNKPDAEKLTIYECGEPTIGSAWVQFDLRYYVVALLFVIFDVEVAFFFPWATVFGTANQLAALPPVGADVPAHVAAQRESLSSRLVPVGLKVDDKEKLGVLRKNAATKTVDIVPVEPEAARGWAQIAFFDILIFFSVLMVGFAYVWRRGDIDWVRAFAQHHEPATAPEKPLEQKVTA